VESANGRPPGLLEGVSENLPSDLSDWPLSGVEPGGENPFSSDQPEDRQPLTPTDGGRRDWAGVDKDNKGRGYEISKGKYVEIEPDKIKAIQVESTHTLDIEKFVPVEEIDRRYFDRSPESGSLPLAQIADYSARLGGARVRSLTLVHSTCFFGGSEHYEECKTL